MLIFFEPEEDRQFKMHKRRIDLLEGVYKELNPAMYKLLCRQLIFEIGETYSSMMDLKSAKLKVCTNLGQLFFYSHKNYSSTRKGHWTATQDSAWGPRQ